MKWNAIYETETRKQLYREREKPWKIPNLPLLEWIKLKRVNAYNEREIKRKTLTIVNLTKWNEMRYEFN